jgi:hypothetical protein
MASKPERKPMTFNVAPPASVPPVVAAPTPAPVGIARADGAERQQVGARVTKATYRQLKARAALTGATVQALVEQAIDEFLAKPTN